MLLENHQKPIIDLTGDFSVKCLKLRSFETQMEDNEFQYLTNYINVDKLENVILINNVQSILPKSIFINMTAIVYLNLEVDNLLKLNARNFEGLNNLKRLIVSSKSLSIIEDKSFFDLKILKYLKI